MNYEISISISCKLKRYIYIYHQTVWGPKGSIATQLSYEYNTLYAKTEHDFYFMEKKDKLLPLTVKNVSLSFCASHNFRYKGFAGKSLK